MNHSWWKIALSHFKDLHLETAPSEVNEEVHLYLSRGRYMLHTRNVIYSYDDLYLNYRKAFERWQWNENKSYATLSLGFGLGSTAYLLQRQGCRIEKFTGIEYDVAVLEMAKKYSIQRLNFPVELIHAHAQEWLRESVKKYDLLLMDVFVDKFTPPEFRSGEFAEKMKDALRPGGTVMYNFLAENEEDYSVAENYFNEIFKPIFPNAAVLSVHSNYIFVNDSSQFKSPFIFS